MSEEVPYNNVYKLIVLSTMNAHPEYNMISYSGS